MNNKELLLVADALSQEKGISQEEVLNALADGMETALRKDFPEGSLISIFIDHETGDMVGYRKFELVEQIENPEAQMLFSEVEDEIVEDGFVFEEFALKLDRQKYNIAKQVASQKIKQGSREHQFIEMMEKPVRLFNGIVKVARKDQLIVDSNGLDVTIWRRNLAPRENFKIGEKITFTLEKDKNQYFGTRISDDYLKEVFTREIYQIEEGDIEVVSVARNPGFRAKVIVKSNVRNLDPVKLCIGAKGVHIKNIQSYVNGEFIDVIEYNEDPAQQLISAFAPIAITNIIIDEETHSMDIGVADIEIGKAIGKGNKNIETISRLIGWKLNVVSQTDWQKNETSSVEKTIAVFQESLNCDREIAEHLVAEGFSSLEEVAYVSNAEFEEAGFDLELIENLKYNAKLVLDNPEELKKAEGLGDLVELGFSTSDIEKLRLENVFTKEDVADLGTFDLTDILPELEESQSQYIILKARSKDPRFQDQEVNA